MTVAPQQLVPTTVVQRVGLSADHVQLINLSISATIWVGANASVSPGVGTPLNPGSAMEWACTADNRSLYFVAGTDTASTLATDEGMIVSYEVSNWQPNPAAIAVAALNSGSILVDQPALLYGPTTGPLGGSFGPLIDVSKYQSVTISFERLSNPPLTTAPTDYIEVLWNSFTYTNIRDRMWLTSKSLNVTDGRYSYTLPVRGATMSVIYQMTVVPPENMTITGSNRPFVTMNQKDGMVVAFNAPALPVGNTFVEMKFPYRGKATLHMTSNNAAGIAACIMVDPSNGRENIYGSTIANAITFGTVTGGETEFDIYIPFSFSRVRLANLAAVVQAASLEIVVAD